MSKPTEGLPFILPFPSSSFGILTTHCVSPTYAIGDKFVEIIFGIP